MSTNGSASTIYSVDEDQRQETNWLRGRRAWWAVGAVYLLIGLAWWYTKYSLQNDQGRGTFGDMFGGTNALFSGLAFATLIITAWMQRTELSLQRRELANTRAVMREQSETQKLQRFEGTFFAMLAAHDRVIQGLQQSNVRDHQGRLVLKEYAESFRADVKQQRLINGNLSDIQRSVEVSASRYSASWNVDLGKYFRSLYHLFKLVDGAGLSEPKRYTSLVRAYMNGDEQLLLLVNCALGPGAQKFLPLVERYELLENMPQSGLDIELGWLSLVDIKAFGADGPAVWARINAERMLEASITKPSPP